MVCAPDTTLIFACYRIIMYLYETVSSAGATQYLTLQRHIIAQLIPYICYINQKYNNI